MGAKKSYGKYGKFVDTGNVVRLVVTALTKDLLKGNGERREKARGGNVILIGERGAGKTLLWHKLSDDEDPAIVKLWKEKGLEVPELLKASAHEEQGYVDWVVQDVLQDATTKVREQIVLKWLRPCEPNRPRVLLIDDANFLSPSVMGFLHPLLDWQQSLWVPEMGRYYERSPLHWLALCINPATKQIYAGAKEMNQAFADRFVQLYMRYMTKMEEVEWLQELIPEVEYGTIRKYVEFAHATRAAFEMEALYIPVTPRNLVDYLNLIAAGLSEEEVLEFVLGPYPPEQHRQVKALWQGQEVERVFKSLRGESG